MSIIFQVKIILYTTTEDYYLASTIINTKFEKTIQIIRVQGCQFDPVYSKNFITNAGLCQNLILDVILLKHINFE